MLGLLILKIIIYFITKASAFHADKLYIKIYKIIGVVLIKESGFESPLTDNK